MLSVMARCKWIDPYAPDPRRPVQQLPQSGAAATLGVCIAGDEKRGAVMICPGGGYENLADHEGLPVAQFINGHGVHAFVLRYRHAPHARHPAPLEDARRAMRVIRHGATEGWWPVDPGKITVLGFSAGGHVAALLATDSASWTGASGDAIEAENCRPDAQALAYPVIHMSKPTAHAGCRANLLGDGSSEELARSLDADDRVTPQTPPAFIFHTAADKSVPAENSFAYAAALAKHGVPVDLHIFADGEHGVGLADGDDRLRAWPWLLAQWLGRMGW